MLTAGMEIWLVVRMHEALVALQDQSLPYLLTANYASIHFSSQR